MRPIPILLRDLEFLTLVELDADKKQPLILPVSRTIKRQNELSRLRTYENPAYREGLALARLGLIRPALAAWGKLFKGPDRGRNGVAD